MSVCCLFFIIENKKENKSEDEELELYAKVHNTKNHETRTSKDPVKSKVALCKDENKARDKPVDVWNEDALARRARENGRANIMI